MKCNYVYSWYVYVSAIFQYLDENKDKPVISVYQMAQELHAQYRYCIILLLNTVFAR